MTPLISWLIIGGIGLAIYLAMNALYIDSLKREIESNKPPF
jgi:preprotein translocase subunit Sss1